MKKTLKIFIIAFLLCILTYVCKIDSIPNNLIIYNDSSSKIIDLGYFLGINYKLNDKDLNTVLASSSAENEINKENIVQVKLFDTINLKNVSVDIIDKTTVIPVGQVSGLKLYTNGVMVVGMSEIKAEDGQKYKPYEDTKIKEGDRIIKINDIEIENTTHLIDIVNKSKGEVLDVEYIKDDMICNEQIVPIKAQDQKYKLGLWVRDSNAGIGTLSIYEPSTGNFAALGHGITDIDTGGLVEISDGEFLTTNIISIDKGKKGAPRKNKRYNR